MRFAALTGILRSVFLVAHGSDRAHTSLKIVPLVTENTQRINAFNQCVTLTNWVNRKNDLGF